MSTKLPSNVAQPAHRALASVGVTTLEDLKDHTERELRALHGLGPSGLKRLKEAMKEIGIELASP